MSDRHYAERCLADRHFIKRHFSQETLGQQKCKLHIWSIVNKLKGLVIYKRVTAHINFHLKMLANM